MDLEKAQPEIERVAHGKAQPYLTSGGEAEPREDPEKTT